MYRSQISSSFGISGKVSSVSHYDMACRETPSRSANFSWLMFPFSFRRYRLDLPREPEMRVSAESRELRFFTKEELKEIEIPVTHRDIVQELFLEA